MSKNVYIAEFIGSQFLPFAKIGISKDPEARIRQINKWSDRHGDGFDYNLYAIIYVLDDQAARKIERAVCDKFERYFGNEFLDAHPEKVLQFCKRMVGEKVQIWERGEQ